VLGVQDRLLASGDLIRSCSADGGKTWTEVTYPLFGSWGSLSYVSRTVGWVVAGQPGLGSGNQLWRTSDAGLTWHPAGY
jgi:photosystem II stability/assembly factor-like uncharacterized protein